MNGLRTANSKLFLPLLEKLRQAFKKAVHVLSRPAKADRGQGGIVIQPYRGFGSVENIFLMGRVFHQQGRNLHVQERTQLRDIIDLFRRILRRPVASAALEVRFYGATTQTTADRRGYFLVGLHHRQQSLPKRLWHPVSFQLSRTSYGKSQADGEVFIPPPTAKFAVISDIDDTIVYTGVANKFMMVWHLFAQNARTRTAFPGVAAFYRALHRGVDGNERNPMLYVSRGPWSIYELLDEFFKIHNIPIGPILFLRDWKLKLYRPFPPRGRGYKRALIHRMLSFYHELPFILIGDSGQRDPEIYLDTVRKFPGRVLCVYIRNIGSDRNRDRVIQKIAGKVTTAGSILILASESFEMAAHAADQGYIPTTALPKIASGRRRQEG